MLYYIKSNKKGNKEMIIFSSAFLFGLGCGSLLGIISNAAEKNFITMKRSILICACAFNGGSFLINL